MAQIVPIRANNALGIPMTHIVEYSGE